MIIIPGARVVSVVASFEDGSRGNGKWERGKRRGEIEVIKSRRFESNKNPRIINKNILSSFDQARENPNFRIWNGNTWFLQIIIILYRNRPRYPTRTHIHKLPDIWCKVETLSNLHWRLTAWLSQQNCRHSKDSEEGAWPFEGDGGSIREASEEILGNTANIPSGTLPFHHFQMLRPHPGMGRRHRQRPSCNSRQ